MRYETLFVFVTKCSTAIGSQTEPVRIVQQNGWEPDLTLENGKSRRSFWELFFFKSTDSGNSNICVWPTRCVNQSECLFLISHYKRPRRCNWRKQCSNSLRTIVGIFRFPTWDPALNHSVALFSLVLSANQSQSNTSWRRRTAFIPHLLCL